MSIEFLQIDDVLEIHRDQVDRYGGDTGIRDVNGLLSAIAMPQAGAGGEYFHSDLFDMAAAYLFHIINNHPFVDGNKRTALVAAIVFLDLNGVEISADENELADFVLAVATGCHDKSAITHFLRTHSGA